MGSAPQESQGMSRASLLALIQGHRGALLRLAGTSMVGGLAEALFLVLVTRTAFALTDDRDRFGVLAGYELDLASALLIAAVLLLLRFGFSVWAVSQGARLTSSVIAELRQNLASAFLRSSWATQQDSPSGALQELLTTFSQRGGDLVASMTLATTSGFNLAALLVMAVVVDPVGAVAVLTAVGLLGLALRPLRAAVGRRAQRSALTGMRFATRLNEISQLGLELHVFDVKLEAEARAHQLIAESAEADRRANIARALVPPVYTAMAYTALLSALVFVSAVDVTSLTSLGTVMLIMLRSLSYGQGVQSSLATVSAASPFMAALDAELARLRSAAVLDSGAPVDSVGVLAVRDVTFSYRPGAPVLSDVTLTIPPRRIVGIVGPSGGGKSTFVQLLLGLRAPDHGVVEADGRPIHELSRSEWARRVTFVPQAPHLIAGTVADNIRFLRGWVTDEAVERAAELAHVHTDIAAFPGGYGHEVGERGGHLSGGQQQRLCIARALVEDPDILILDEPTSSLDPRSEHLIRQTLLELRERMTIILIAHRLTTLDICDRIMVIQAGRVRAFDTPAELERSNEFYRDALRMSGLR